MFPGGGFSTPQKTGKRVTQHSFQEFSYFTIKSDILVKQNWHVHNHKRDRYQITTPISVLRNRGGYTCSKQWKNKNVTFHAIFHFLSGRSFPVATQRGTEIIQAAFGRLSSGFLPEIQSVALVGYRAARWHTDSWRFTKNRHQKLQTRANCRT